MNLNGNSQESCFLGTIDLLTRLEQEANDAAKRKSVAENSLLELNKLQETMAELQKYKAQLVEDCFILMNSEEDHFTLNELMSEKLEQMRRMYRLIGVSVEPLGQDVTRIHFQTSYDGHSCESYFVDLKLDRDSPIVIHQHNIPESVPLSKLLVKLPRQSLNVCLENFVWNVYRYLNAYTSRMQNAQAVKSLTGISNFTSSAAFDTLQFTLSFSVNLTVTLSYADLLQELPSVVVLADKRALGKFSTNALETMNKLLMTHTLSQLLPNLVELCRKCLNIPQ